MWAIDYHLASVIALESGLPETQGVGYNGYRAEAHGGAGDHRVQEDAGEWIENPGSNWHAEHIVDTGKEKVCRALVGGSASA